MGEPPYEFCVLVVSADAGATASLLRQIHELGHSAHAAPSHAEALRLARTLAPHVILLDVAAPLGDHRALTHDFRAIAELSEVYLIALTSYDAHTNRPTSIAAGFDDHLWKPVGPKLLEALLNYLVLKLRSQTAARPEGGCAD